MRSDLNSNDKAARPDALDASDALDTSGAPGASLGNGHVDRVCTMSRPPGAIANTASIPSSVRIRTVLS